MAKKVADWRTAETRLRLTKGAYRDAANAASAPGKKRTRQEDLIDIIANAHEILVFCQQTFESDKRRGVGQSRRHLQIHEEARQCGSDAARLILARYQPRTERREMLEKWLNTVNPTPATPNKVTVKA